MVAPIEPRPTAEEIRSTRKACGLTVVQAAAVIGITRETWHRYECPTHPSSMHPVLWKAWRIRVGLAAPETILVRFLTEAPAEVTQ